METTQEPRSETVVSDLGPIGQFVESAWIVLGVLDDFATRRMQQLERTIRSATSIGGRQFWTKLEGGLDPTFPG